LELFRELIIVGVILYGVAFLKKRQVISVERFKKKFLQWPACYLAIVT